MTYPGFNVLLMGPSGTGKTFSIGKLVMGPDKVPLPLDVFYLGLEPGLESIMGYFIDPPPFGLGLKQIPENFHWHALQTTMPSMKQMKETADKIGKFDQSGLAKMKDPNRALTNPMIGVYEALNNFVDSGSGKEYGPVDDWLPNRVLVIDSLTELALLEMKMAIGDKPVRDKPDYGLAQGNLMSALHKLTNGCGCHFILLAHVDREVDEVMGGIKLMPHLGIGKAILPDIPRNFSDVILTVREGDKFYWDTANSQADLKTRNLPIKSRLDPDFRQIFNTWKLRRDAAMAR